MRRKKMWVPAVLLLVGGLLGGCATLGQEKTGVAATMDMQDAAERADGMLSATFDAIEPEVQWAHGQTSSGNCEVTRRRTVLTIISEQRRGNFLGMVERFWKKAGYEIYSVNPSKDYPAIFARASDGFAISLLIGDKGQAFFEVDTPCVEESKVAAPTAAPNGPAYEGVEVPRPNVRSDFWSAETPVASPSPWSSTPT
ncbi:hypothetical protein [Streptomyces sp. NPDC058595]|uniref:hypothetical protein n=1 Tax=Streptomyces sp. NPDC058595 TaxID=3346550 RepID=UPI003652E9D7